MWGVGERGRIFMKRGGDQGEGKRGGTEGAWEMVGFGGWRGGGKILGIGACILI